MQITISFNFHFKQNAKETVGIYRYTTYYSASIHLLRFVKSLSAIFHDSFLPGHILHPKSGSLAQSL